MSTNRQALALMVIGVAALATNDAIIRWVGADGMPVGQMIVIRGVAFMVLLATGDRFLSQSPIRFRDVLHKWCVLRGIFELGATYLFLTSLFLIPIATATTLVFVSPVILTAASRFIFRERVGPWRWAAVVAGFGGVLLVTGMGTDHWDPAMLLPLGAALFVATRDSCTRMVADHIPSSAVSMSTGLFVCAGGLLSIPWGWEIPAVADISWLALTALIIAVSYYCYIVAVRIGELSLLAPIQYSIILWATLFGWLIWDEVPENRAILGGAVIIASGLLILCRERVARLRSENSGI